MNALAEIYVNLPKNLAEVTVDFYNQIIGDNYSKCDTGTVTPLRKIKK